MKNWLRIGGGDGAMKTLRKIGRLWTQLWQWFPPGYEFVWERNTAAVLLALPVVLSLRYFGKLREAVEWLYYVDGDRGRVLRPDGAAKPFLELAGEYGGLFVPYFLFLAIMAAFHYAYYHRETKSIYLMRRLPRRSVLVASCVRAPLLGMAGGAAAEAVLGLIYYGIYLLVMPGVCAPGFW